MNSIEQLYKQGALAAEQGSQVVFVEGAANLVTGEQGEGRRSAGCDKRSSGNTSG